MLRRKVAASLSSSLAPPPPPPPPPPTRGMGLMRPPTREMGLMRLPTRCFSTSSAEAATATAAGTKKRSFMGKAIPIVLISLTGGVALSALNDLAIFHGCSSTAIEMASHNQKIIEALGEPIVRGPWYDASLAVGHRRHSVSCTFPVSGPQGSGIFQLKAVRRGEDGWFSFLRHHDWDILIMDALLNVPTNDEKNQTFRVSVTHGALPPTGAVDCKDCKA